MTTFDAAAITASFKALFSNGKGEAGLEVGADPGLPASEHIRIPACMKKSWCAKLDAEGTTARFGAGSVAVAYKGTPAAMAGEVGWVTAGELEVHEGDICVFDERDVLEVIEFHIEPTTALDLQRFVTVNIGHVRDDTVPADCLQWIHACRFWAVVAGLVTTSKSSEWVEVANPAQIAAGVDEIAAYIAGFSANAWTASAARAASWRKSNHATGGDIVQGFPRRWLNKMGVVHDLPDRNAARTQLRNLTSAFYVATHASSVHAVLALMAPGDSSHWARITPDYGFISKWDIGHSAKIRMEPTTQVAGTAIVVDAVVVLRMTIKEGLAPLIGAVDQVGALMAAYRTVERYGVRCATYARWFLDGHPNAENDSSPVVPVRFDQKDGAFADLAGELAIIGTKYYHSSTIGQSAALSNAASQLGSEEAKATWAALAAQRQRISGQQVIAAVQAIKGASAVSAVSDMLDTDAAVVRGGVARYNAQLAALATAAGVTSGFSVNADRVVLARLGDAAAAAPAAAAPAAAAAAPAVAPVAT